MLSRTWKKELVDRSISISKYLDKEGISHSLVGIGANAIQFAVQTSQSIDGLLRSLFRAWPDVVGTQICRNENATRIISIIFDVAELDENAPAGSEENGLDESLEGNGN